MVTGALSGGAAIWAGGGSGCGAAVTATTTALPANGATMSPRAHAVPSNAWRRRETVAVNDGLRGLDSIGNGVSSLV
jgi:hypothetical protein